MALPLTVLSCCLLLAPASSEVDALEAAGKYRKAASEAEDLAQAYPQDYGWTLRAAWLRFQAQHYRRATVHYRRAIELSGGSLESRLGLSWSLLYDGHRRQAIAELETLKRDYPEAPEIDEALAFARARGPVAYRPWASVTGQLYGNHPTLERGLGIQGGLSLTIAEHTLLAASYGFARIGFDPIVTDALLADSLGAGNGNGAGNGSGSGNGNGNGNGNGATNGAWGNGNTSLGDSADQHQVHVAIGPVWAAGGVTLQYGFLYVEGLPDLHAIGTSMRWSPWGDIVLAANTTIEADVVRPRIEPSWKLPVHEHVWLRPAFSMQIDDGVLPTGMLTLGVHGRPGALWLGGKYGRERRPAYLDTPVIFNIPGDIRWGGWVGGQLELPANMAFFAAYELDGVEVQTEAALARTQAHYITLGLSFRHP